MAHVPLDALDQRNLDSYTDEAACYDRKRFSVPSRQFYVDLSNQLIAELIALRPGVELLDVATGTGRIALHMARLGADVVGVDLTPAMLEKARQKAETEGLKNLRLEIANARSLPFEDDRFDAVTAIRFLHLVPADVQREILEEMCRVVRPGGVVVAEFNNIFSGVCYRLLHDAYQRVFKGIPQGGRTWPFQLNRQMAGFRVVRKRGYWFLGLGRLARLNRKLALALDGLARLFPFYYLTDQLLVVIEKPHEHGDHDC